MLSKQFIPDEWYHLYNRGVDKRPTFESESNLERFVDGMRVFNTTEDSCEPISFRRRCERNYQATTRLVKIQTFCLMPNHFHILSQEAQTNGTSSFMQRLGTGYTKYFNKQAQRSGCLFESAFKGKHVKSQAYLEHLTRYVHLNALSLIGINWKLEGVTDKDRALNFLSSYRWSSFFYYYNDIPSPILDLSLLKGLFQSPDEYVEYLFAYQPTECDEEVDFL